MTLETLDLAGMIRRPSDQAKMNLALLYGPPGGGKTHLALSTVEVEELRPLLVIDTEASTEGTATAFGDYDDDIFILSVSTHTGMEEVLNQLKYTGGINFDGELFVPKTVIIDTFDVAQDRALKVFDEQVKAEGGNRNEDFKKYGLLGEWSAGIAQFFRDADFFGILVTHTRNEELETGGTKIGINLVGGARNTVPGLPDIVGYIERHDGVTIAQFESSKKYVSKNRHGLPAQMENPSFADIHAVVKSNSKKEA